MSRGSSAASLRVSYATLQYYMREKLWRHAESIAAEKVASVDDWTFRVWQSFCVDMQQNANDALRGYKQCESRRETAVPALIGMSIIYRRNRDEEGVRQTEQRLQDERLQGSIGQWMQGASMLWHSGDTQRARDTLNKLIDQNSSYRDEYTSIQTLKGWLDLQNGRGAFLEKCLTSFENVLQSEGQSDLLDIDAQMGKVGYLDRKGQSWPAQELLNKLVVVHPHFTPALVVKARGLMRAEDWEQACEITQRILAKDPMNIEAIVLSILYLLVKDARHGPAATQIHDLLAALGQREPRNAFLYFQCSQCFARLGSTNLQFLGLTIQLAEKALALSPASAECQSEVAFQTLLRGDLRNATLLYKKATNNSDGIMAPTLGLIRCLIMGNKLPEAAQQIEFPNEIQSAQQRNAELLLLNAMLVWKKDKNQAGSVEKLDQAAEAHKHDLLSLTTSAELYIKLNPPLMLEIAREYVQHCRTEPPEPGMVKNDPIAEKCRRHLELLLRHVPACTEAQLLLSKICFVSGDIDRASSMIGACIRLDQSLPDSYLLSAQIHQHAGNVTAANQALEQALTLDFEIRDQPQYNLLKGTILGMMGEFSDALATLQMAQKQLESASTAKGRPIRPLSVQDHVSLYLQLGQTMLRLRRVDDARNVISDATRVFAATSQVGRINIAHAMIVARTDVENALEILRAVPPKSEFYIAAKARMASLYLVHRQNRRAFAKCYEELVEGFPSVQSFICLGEAYASIQEPEKAILAFEKARAMDPNNADLAVRIGRTLVTTHDYHRALRYYRDAVAADSSKFNLRQDLAMLFWRLGDVDKAITVLRDSPVLSKQSGTSGSVAEDMSTAVERVNVALLMCKIFRSVGNSQQAIESLIQARVFQNAVLTRMRSETVETQNQQRQIAASICMELGDFYAGPAATAEKGFSFFNEALKHDETNEGAMLLMAKYYLARGETEGCEQQCNALLRVNPGCEEAIMILADLMFRKNRYEDAAFHFHQLLDKKPDNYNALVHYVKLLRRSGHLQDAAESFAAAEALLRPGQKADPGLCYAKGLYHRYTNKNTDALKEFNAGRLPKDNPFSQQCLVAIIEIYIMPDNENLWEDSENREAVMENVNTAERLLSEVSDLGKRSILQGYCMMATKKRDNLEKAIAKFFEIVTDADQANGVDNAAASKAAVAADSGDGDGTTLTDQMHVPGLVGLATALQLMKQTPKARNHLKRVAKATYRPEYDDDFERGWLLLSDIYIANGKYDLAQELLRRAIQANKSCCRAWEYMGLIFEKEQSYKDAADCYENAWKLVKESDPGIGFKLAFNYLKAKKLVQAIDTCHKVLATHPNYPKIKKEVLERARSLIRP